MLEPQAPAKKVQDETEKYRCPISLLIFLDPVVASDGHTYEREEIEQVINSANPVSPKTREVLTKTLTPNHDKRGAVIEYLEAHPELYDQNEVYLSTKLKQRLVDALQEGNVKEVTETLQKDSRLIKIALTDSGKTCLSLSCMQTSLDVLKIVLKRSSDLVKAELRLPSTLAAFELLSDVAKNMGNAGLETWCQALDITPSEAFLSSLAFCAVSLKDLGLLKAATEKLSVDFVEAQTKRSLLHKAAQACIESLQTKKSSEVPAELVAIIKYLYSRNINAKLKDKDGLTAAELATHCGYPMITVGMETERRRAKLLPIFGPLQESQAKLLVEVRRLAAENTQLRSALDSTQQELSALSSTLIGAELKKIEQAFKPSTCKSYSHMGEVSGIIMVGQNHMVAGVVDSSSSSQGKICVWDLSKPSNASCIKTITIEKGSGFKGDNDFFALDDSRFVFLEKRGKPQGQHTPPAKLVIWNVVTNEEEKSFALEHSHVRLIQAVNKTTVFFSCSRGKSNFRAALFDITTGKVTPHEYLDVQDYDRTTFISDGAEPRLGYIKEGRSDKKGLYLHNCLTREGTSLLTGDELYGYSEFTSVFKFISKTLIAIRLGDHRDKKPLRLFDLQGQQFVQSFSHPKVKQGWDEAPPLVLGASSAGTDRVATVAVVKENFQLIIWDMLSGTAKHQVEISAKMTEHPIPMMYDAHRDLLYVVCGDVINAIQLNPDLTNTAVMSAQRSLRRP